MDQFSPLSEAEQIAVLLAVTRGLLDHLPIEEMGKAQQAILEKVRMEPEAMESALAAPGADDGVWEELLSRLREWPNRCIPIIGLPEELMFKHFFREYLFVSLFRAFAQSLAGENAARLMAMQAAEKNILELAEDLQAGFRELRQAAITDELLDIISGFEALSDETHAL